MNLYLLLSIIFVFLILAFRSFRAINIKKAKALKISEWDENIMAYHEAGHTVVFAELLNKNLLKVVTIVPSENEFGATKAIFSENLNETYSELIKKIAVVLAGRLSEEILLNETTTSAIHDLNEANFLASNMVLQFGMGKNIKFLRIEEEKLKLCSNELKQRIEEDIFSIIEEASILAEKTIKKNSSQIERIAKILLSKKTIVFSDLQKILD